MKALSAWILGAVLLVSLAEFGRAQTTRIHFRQRARLHRSALVPGAKVVLINEASKAEWNATSNGEGFFSFPAIQAATYTLRVSHTGFETWSVTGIVVHPGDSLTVPKIALKVGRAEISITVTRRKRRGHAGFRRSTAR